MKLTFLKKTRYTINLIDAIGSLALFWWIGEFIDKQINKKRAEKANVDFS